MHVRAFLVYRALLALGFLGLFLFGPADSFIASYTQRLYQWTVWVYLVSIGVSIFIHIRGRESCENQTYLMVFLDIPAVVLLTHASGGIGTGLTMLLAVSIGFGGAIIRGRAVLVFSAIAALAVITAEVYADLRGAFGETHYTQAGFLGLSFFAMAVLAETMARRLRESERVITQHEINLADLAQLNEAIIQHFETGILVVDAKGRVRLFNKSAVRLLGKPNIRAGQPLSTVSRALDNALAGWLNREDMRTGTFSPRGASHQLQGHFVSLGSGQHAGALIFVEDISNLNERAHQMKLASLGQLVASIAHEVRNPLGAISHAGQLLSEAEQLKPEDKRLTRIIHQHSQRVNGIIEDMLMLSRRERVSPENLDLAKLVREIVEDVRDQNQLPDDVIELHCHASTTRLIADQGQFRQILTNLLNNAVRHSKRDVNELRVRISAGVSERFGSPYLEVADNGIGVPDSLREQVFEPFFTTNARGTGLGLFVTRELCEANGMRLELVRNSPLGGACFRLLLPRMVISTD